MTLVRYFYSNDKTKSSDTTQSSEKKQLSRFLTCGEFDTLNLHLTKIITKKNKLFKEIEELQQRNDPAKKQYLLLSQIKHTIFLKLVDDINKIIEQFNNQIPSAEIEDKQNQYQLVNELVLCFLDCVKNNIEVLAELRDTNKIKGTIFLLFGAISGAVAITSLASCSWPVVLLSAYLADRACALGCYVSGVDINITMTDSTILIFNALQELIVINNKLYKYAAPDNLVNETRDFYEILNVPFEASKEEITKAYRTLSIKYHPDKNKQLSKTEIADFTAKFIVITEAYQTLTDPQKKSSYDLRYASLRRNGPT